MLTAYEVTMTQGPNETTRRCVLPAQAQVVSRRQLAGYLTHTLFADVERGGDNTFYTIREQVYGQRMVMFTVERKADGHYHTT